MSKKSIPGIEPETIPVRLTLMKWHPCPLCSIHSVPAGVCLVCYAKIKPYLIRIEAETYDEAMGGMDYVAVSEILAEFRYDESVTQ